jgi:hypothetical protein
MAARKIIDIRKAPSSWIVTHSRQGRLLAWVWRSLTLLLLATASFAQSATTFVPQDEQEIVRLVNNERRARGLAMLSIDERLRQAARKHSVRMADAGQVEHQLAGEAKLSLRLGETALRFDASGENVALTSNAARAHTALMNSPGHRANILDTEFNSIGVGVVRTAEGIFVTQDFAKRLPEINVDEAEAQVAFSLNRLRRMAGAPVLSRVPALQLRKRACEMAANNKLNPRAGLSPKVSNSVAFTAIDFQQVPDSLERLKTHPASGFSVGACYEASATYENPVFWVIVVTYF